MLSDYTLLSYHVKHKLALTTHSPPYPALSAHSPQQIGLFHCHWHALRFVQQVLQLLHICSISSLNEFRDARYPLYSYYMLYPTFMLIYFTHCMTRTTMAHVSITHAITQDDHMHCTSSAASTMSSALDSSLLRLSSYNCSPCRDTIQQHR